MTAEFMNSWFLTSGVISLFIILLLSIVLTALCSECSRRSFKLQDSEANKDPSALIKVVQREEELVERENPMINETQKDEKELNPSEANTASFPPWRSHLRGPPNHQDLNSEEENPIPFTPWRSHLKDPSEQVEVVHEVVVEMEEEEGSFPPLPDGRTQLEG